jgi:hypothetical protein
VEVFPSFVGTVLSGIGTQVSGSGLWHSTTGTLDQAALVGTEGQILFTNATPDTQFLYPSNDISSSNTTPGKLTVVGFNSIPIFQGILGFNQSWYLNNNTNQWVNSAINGDLSPSNTVIGAATVVKVQGFPWTSGNPGTNNVPQFNGTSWVFVAGSSLGTTFTAGGDLSGTVSAQYIRSLSGNNNGGGQIPLTTNAYIGVNSNVSVIKNGSQVVLGIDSSNNVLFGTNANSPNGILASAQGSQVLQLQSSNGSDFIALGNSVAASGYVRLAGSHGSSATLIGANTSAGGGGDVKVVWFDSTNNMVIGDGGSHFGDITLDGSSGGNVNISIANSGIVAANSSKVGFTVPINFQNGASTTATAGANGAPPAQVVGYLNIQVAGSAFKVPYYNV